MEITESTIYWITRLDGINVALGVLLAVTTVMGSLVCLIGSLEEEWAFIRRFAPKAVAITLVLTLALVFIPTTKEICAIKVIPVIVNDDSVQKIPGDIAELAHEWLEELRPVRKGK